MRSSVVVSTLIFLSNAAFAQEPPPAIPASPPPPTSEGPLAIPAQGQPTAPPPPQYGPPTPIKGYSDGFADGKSAADNKSAGEWVAIGAGSGCFLSWVGCGAATATAALIDPTLPQPYASDFYRSTDLERDYWNGFRAGYAQSMKRKRAIRTFAGGAIGTAVSLGVLIALNGGAVVVE